MSRPSVLSGTLSEGGAIELLRELEEKRITGELRFESDDEAGMIALYGGAIAVEQELRGDGRDSVDVLLELTDGRYEIRPRLPTLPVSKGDDFVKTGSLAVHVPADLMGYCEGGGLTGRLELRHEGRRAEAIYDAGELLAIELDGREDVDLSEVFGWEQGRFRIELDPEAPARFRAAEEAPTTEYVAVPKEEVPGARREEPPREAPQDAPARDSKREDTRQFLRVVEMALVDVLDKSERARSPTRTSPPMPPPPKARPRPPAMPPPPPKKRPDDHTVRLIYLGGDPPKIQRDTSTRHVAKGRASETALTVARPERRAVQAAEPENMANKREIEKEKSKSDGDEPVEAGVRAERVEQDVLPEPAVAPVPASTPEPPANPLASVAWAFGVLLLGLTILALLAKLPPLQ